MAEIKLRDKTLMLDGRNTKIEVQRYKTNSFWSRVILLTSCATSSNTSVTVHKAALDDEEYVSTLENKTREVHNK